MIAQLRPREFAAWSLTQPDAAPLVLDVREPWEFQHARIFPHSECGAFDLLHIPMQEIPGRFEEIPLNRHIVCLCHHGMRSQHVAHYLMQRGFENISNLSGGIDAWSRDMDPQVPIY